MAFVKAERKQAKLKLALVGPSGSGKTYSALLIAKGIGGKIAVIDTERGSASLYSTLVDFDVNELAEFNPENYIEAIKEAVKAGYNVLVIDSLTHEWAATKVLADKLGEVTKNSFTAWGKITPRHQALIDTILQSPIHIICTMRAKTEWAISKDDKTGKMKPVKMGLGADQRAGLEFEFSTIFNIDSESHIATADKDRTGLFTNFADKLTVQTGEQLRAWLNLGEENPDAKKAPQNKKAFVHVLLGKIEKSYEDPKVKERFHAITGKDSMTLWTEADAEKVIAYLDEKIVEVQKSRGIISTQQAKGN